MRVDTWATRSQQPLENVITPHDSHHLYLRSAAPAGSPPPHPPFPLPMAMALWLPLEILTSLGILLGIDFPQKSRHPLAERLPLWCWVSLYQAVSRCFTDHIPQSKYSSYLATNFLALHDHCLNCVSDRGGNCETTWAPFLSTSSIQC